MAVGGAPADNVVSAAPGSSEGIGITAAIMIMLLAFGSVVAMGLPLHHRADRRRASGSGSWTLASHVLTIPDFGPELMAMIGLGVGIDYALLIVTRYRQGLAGGHQPREAAGIALSTAGRAVLFAGRDGHHLAAAGCSWSTCRSWTVSRWGRSSRSCWCWRAP